MRACKVALSSLRQTSFLLLDKRLWFLLAQKHLILDHTALTSVPAQQPELEALWDIPGKH